MHKDQDFSVVVFLRMYVETLFNDHVTWHIETFHKEIKHLVINKYKQILALYVNLKNMFWSDD